VGKTTGFLEFERAEIPRRPAVERVRDFHEFHLPILEEQFVQQAARCMDCGIPFCNTGCPLGNLIPDWNDHAYRRDLPSAIESLHGTNNFPEVTGRVCPAPCETACTLGINMAPVSIKQIEETIADRAFEAGLVTPRLARQKTQKKVAVVGSGPAGLAVAQQLARAGHAVTVLEKADRIGGLLVYGIPDFKLEKSIVARRVEQMIAEGVTFVTGADVGVSPTVAELRSGFDAVCLAMGARVPRDLQVPGRELQGVHFAMEFLEQQNRRTAGDQLDPATAILARDKHILVIGGGDTGSDCIGTSHRQGALSVSNIELMPKPPAQRSPTTPWPAWPLMLRTSTSHEEGGTREFSVMTERLVGKDGRVEGAECVRVIQENGKMTRVAGSEFSIRADLVFLALGFLGPETGGLIDTLGVARDARGNVKVDASLRTSVDGVFAAGDCERGQSLVVWAIADGRKAARSIDTYLMGSTELP
jgi:glutamate synthase (NADPH) small chain